MTKTKTKTKCIEDPTYAIFLKSREFKDIKYDQTRTEKRRIQSRGPNSRTCVLVSVAGRINYLILFQYKCNVLRTKAPKQVVCLFRASNERS